MKIAFVTSETLPFSKTGGLADVVYGLSKSLARRGEEVTVISPLYRGIDKNQLESGAQLPVTLSWRHQIARLYQTERDGVRFLFIANDYYFDRAQLYGYDDDIERFAFFCLALVELVKRLNFRPDVVHVNDWETAMIPLLLKDQGIGLKTVLTIHNPAFQGNGHYSNLGNYFNLSDSYFFDGTCRFHDYVSCLKTGIVTSDLVTTVSKTHARELLDDKISYNGLGHVIALRQSDFIGIVNGVDDAEFSPATDPLLKAVYDRNDYRGGKSLNKLELERIFHQTPLSGPTFGLVSRLTDQKGIDKLLEILPLFERFHARLAVIGSGERRLEEQIGAYALKHPETLLYYGGYSSPLAHLVYAASDYFLMPSRYEPCGIGQLIAKRYGAVPVVADAGGLVDTVRPYKKGDTRAEGIRYKNREKDGLCRAVELAIKLYETPVYHKMVLNGMAADSTWDSIAPIYAAAYLKLQATRSDT